MHELAPLFLREWQEVIGDNPTLQDINVDWDKYIQMELSGLLVLITVRDKDRLIGYALDVIHHHLHFKSVLYCFIDAFWVLPEYRDGVTDTGLIEENEIYLIEAGVKRINFAVNPSLWLYKLMKKMQYTRTECVLAKWL